MREAGGWKNKAGRAALGASVGMLLLGGGFLGGTPTGRYLARAGWEEGRILLARRPIEALVADSTVPEPTRAKLRLVLEVRAFAEDSLGLPVGGSFTTYTDLGRDTLVLVLSGAARDTLAPFTWWFPIVGRVPYKGFFDVDEARAAERALRAQGLDTYLRPSPAFSTLGWFDDPLLSTTLAADSVDLVNTVIHELTHNRYYAPDGAVFNESFANFVGGRGAERFFLARGDTLRAARAAARWRDDRRLSAFWRSVAHSIDSAFAAHPGERARAVRLSARAHVYTDARRRLVDSVAQRFEAVDPRYAQVVALDNAALLARRVYLSDLEGFEGALRDAGGELRAVIGRVIDAHRAGTSAPQGRY